MPCGLYGKLPAKRDFIALGVPRGFLNAWEPWIQGGLSASRMSLGQAWTDAFLRAPIWRFWLGADIATEPVVGAFMPSVDGIGRYFPLTLISRAGGPEGLPPPEIEPLDGWYTLAEAFLLSTLTEGAGFETLTAALADLPEALPSSLPPPTAGIGRLRGGALIGPATTDDFSGAMARLRPLAHAGLHAGMSYWWTAGGEGFPPQAVCCRRMPDPYVFAGLLTGRFDAFAA